MKDLWISFVQLDGTWCPLKPDGLIAWKDEVDTKPDGLVVGEYDNDNDTISVHKEFFEIVGASVKLDRDPAESSNIASLGYAATTRILDVEFSGGDVYRYFNVPHSVFVALMEADSHGKHLAKEIKGKFDYIKLPDA